MEKLEGIKERLARAERVNVKLEAKEKEKKFKFSKPGCEKQFKFNIKMKDRFGVDLKTELEGCFEEKKLPKEIESLVKEVEEVIDKQNVDLKIADEFGFGAVKVFNGEELARNKEEEKKIEVFRKEKSDRERKVRRNVKRFSEAYDKCFNCLRVGHVARDCYWRNSWRSFSDSRR